MNEEQSALWMQVFDNLLSKVSAVVGDLIAVGEWLTSNEGRQQFNDCLAIVVEGFGEEGRVFCKDVDLCSYGSAEGNQESYRFNQPLPFFIIFCRKR